MVKEFTELQGVVGGLYARAQRLPDGVARAIYDHYKPASQEDTIPSLPAGSVVALADKSSTIVDMFAIGLQPTGSRDPFALRRAGNGVVRILVEDDKLNNRLHLAYVCSAAMQNTKAAEDMVLPGVIFEFLLDRFEFYLRETARLNPQVARAVRKAGTTGSDNTAGGHLIGYGKIAGFARALDAQVGSPNVLAVAELLKRTANILRQAKEKKLIFADQESESLLREAAEKELSRQVNEVNQIIQRSYRECNYDAVIAAIASLQPTLNAFFDSVMVMVDDASLRDNRLALLSRTESVVRWAADFSELASI
jgi:glycyl-tRNA synthetase beta chain